MPAIATPPLPEASLLARLRGPDGYRDAFCTHVAQPVTLEAYVAAFYASPAFAPERYALALIGKGSSRADIAALAEGSTARFAAWSVEAREEHQILLRDFRDESCSWLMVERVVEPGGEATRLWFGSGVRRGGSGWVKALMPLHRLYSRVLLAGAVRRLG